MELVMKTIPMKYDDIRFKIREIYRIMNKININI